MLKSRWTSWAPVPNKPTVSVDVKQHFNHFVFFYLLKANVSAVLQQKQLQGRSQGSGKRPGMINRQKAKVREERLRRETKQPKG